MGPVRTHVHTGPFPAVNRLRKDVVLSDVRTPTGLKTAGRDLWKKAIDEFDLSDLELAQLEEAARIRDRIKDLDKAVVTDGVMIPSSQGSRLHPAISEARQQRLALARMLATLALPGLEEDHLPATRGVRGIYGGPRRGAA